MEKFVKTKGGKRVIQRILIANNGMAATKSILSMRQWAYMTFGDEKVLLSCLSSHLIAFISSISWRPLNLLPWLRGTISTPMLSSFDSLTHMLRSLVGTHAYYFWYIYQNYHTWTRQKSASSYIHFTSTSGATIADGSCYSSWGGPEVNIWWFTLLPGPSFSPSWHFYQN